MVLAHVIGRGARSLTHVLTAHADEAQARAAMEAGADDLAIKPLDPAELERKLITAQRVTDGAKLAGERLRGCVEELSLERPAGGIVTASVGVAGLGSPACSPDELFELADRALYRAKEGGRNKVEVEVAGPPDRDAQAMPRTRSSSGPSAFRC